MTIFLLFSSANQFNQQPLSHSTWILCSLHLSLQSVFVFSKVLSVLNASILHPLLPLDFYLPTYSRKLLFTISMSCIKTNFHKLLIVRRKTVDDVDDQWLSEWVAVGFASEDGSTFTSQCESKSSGGTGIIIIWISYLLANHESGRGLARPGHSVCWTIEDVMDSRFVWLLWRTEWRRMLIVDSPITSPLLLARTIRWILVINRFLAKKNWLNLLFKWCGHSLAIAIVWLWRLGF